AGVGGARVALLRGSCFCVDPPAPSVRAQGAFWVGAHDMARPRKGTIIKTRDGRWQAMVTRADGTRKRLKPFPKGTSEAMAREKAAYHAELAASITPKQSDTKRGLPDTPMARWFGAWIADREARGITTTDRNRNHYQLQIVP